MKTVLKLKSASLLFAAACMLGGCGSDENEKQESSAKTVNVTGFVQQAGAAESGIWKGELAEKLNQETGIVYENVASSAQDDNKLKLFLAAGNIPDIIGFGNVEQARLYVDAGVLLPLDEYREQLSEIFDDKDYETAIEYSSRYISNSDGKLFVLPVSVGAASEKQYSTVPMLLESSYDKLGQPEIASLEGYLELIERMMERSPTSELGEGMLGICLYKENEFTHAASLAKYYGIDMSTVSSLMEISVSDMSASSIFHEKSFYRRAMQFYFEAYQKGLLDKDSRNQTKENAQRKINASRVLFVGDPDIENNLKEGEYTYAAAKDMVLCVDGDHEIGINQYYAIYRDSPVKDKALELLNWLCNDENEKLMYENPKLSGIFGELPKTIGKLENDGFDIEYPANGFTADNYCAQAETDSAIYAVDGIPSEYMDDEEKIKKLVNEYSWKMIYAKSQEEFISSWNELCQKAYQMGAKEIEDYYIGALKDAQIRISEYEVIK